MIDPKKIVRYDYTDEELEELIIFCVCVAGKTASTIAPAVALFLNGQPAFEVVRGILEIDNTGWILSQRLKKCGIGCYNQKSETLKQIVNANLDLRTCSVSDLEAIKGIGPKTARFFIMSSRRGVQHAALDTHILRWMKDQGIENVPKSTPSGKKYLDLEQTYLKMVPEGKTPAEFDLEIWNQYSNKKVVING